MNLALLLRRQRGALIADFVRFYGASPWSLWSAGMSLFDIADCAENLPAESATARALDPEYEWRPLAAQVVIAATNELRLLRADVIRALGGKSKPDLIRPPSATAEDVDIKRIGASDGFESFAEADAWYRAHFPDARI